MKVPAPKPSSETLVPTLAIVGNPNTGKTTLFNSLTGLKQKVGNYAGVTVEKKYGYCYVQHGKRLRLLDLPGSYSLNAQSPDESLVYKILLNLDATTGPVSGILYVLDATQIERQLYLAIQLIELGWPLIVILTSVQEAKKRGITIDIKKLSEALGLPVLTYDPKSIYTLLRIKIALTKPFIHSSVSIAYPKNLQAIFTQTAVCIQKIGTLNHLNPAGVSKCLLMQSSNQVLENSNHHFLLKALNDARTQLTAINPDWRSTVIQIQQAYIRTLINKDSNSQPFINLKDFTYKTDKILLHPVIGYIVLILILLGVFTAVFNLATFPMQGIRFILNSLQTACLSLMSPSQIRNLVTGGIIPGIGNVLLFLPQILLLFFFIGLLELSGYLPRAAFLLDKIMAKVGLQGKAFIPLITSYGCSVPAIMATRTITSLKERLTTILVAPWISCSARLPIYLLLINLLFEPYAAWVKGALLFALYLISMGCALVAAWILRTTILKGPIAAHFIELPPYRIPNLKNIAFDLLERTSIFLKRAGTVILSVSILLWFLMAYPRHDRLSDSQQLQASFGGRAGKLIEPIIQPLGYDWKIGICLISSLGAREVFLTTLAIVYNVEDNTCTGPKSCCCGKPKKSNLPDALKQQKRSDGTLLYTPLTCLSLLAFFMFALQCTSTIAVVYRETNGLKWPLFQLLCMTGTAYLVALIIYQGGKLLGFS